MTDFWNREWRFVMLWHKAFLACVCGRVRYCNVECQKQADDPFTFDHALLVLLLPKLLREFELFMNKEWRSLRSRGGGDNKERMLYHCVPSVRSASLIGDVSECYGMSTCFV